MKKEIIDTIDKLRIIEAEWNRLLQRYPGNNPFLTFDWMISWLEVFGNELRLLVIVISNEKGVIGIAPLVINNKKLLSFIGYPQNDYADIIVDPDSPEALEEILKTIYDHRGEWNRVILDQFPAEKSQFEPLQKLLEKSGGSFRAEPADSCPAMVLDDLVAAKKMFYKRNITTYINWFKQQGNFEYRVFFDPDTALRRLEDLFNQHIKRWEGSATPSAFRKERMKNLYRGFVRRMFPKGWIQISGLALDDKYLALYLSFEYNQVLYLYKTCFNPDYARRSPGQVILRYLFDYAVGKNIRELDFARGDEGYKDRFANLVRRNRRLIIYRSRFAMTWANMFYKARHSGVADLLYRNRTVQKAKYNLQKSLVKKEEKKVESARDDNNL